MPTKLHMSMQAAGLLLKMNYTLVMFIVLI